MKLRKAGLFGRTKSRTPRTRKQKRLAFRRLHNCEQLEARQLMAADWNPQIVANAARFNSPEARTAAIQYVTAMASGATSGLGGGEGFSNTNLLVQETEPNNSRGFANFVPLGFHGSGFSGINFAGTTNGVLDEDYVAFDLSAGDILDARIAATPTSPATISLFNASGRELATTTSSAFGGFPLQSPISSAGNAALHYVIGQSGRYFFRVADVNGSYTASLRVYRSSIESEPAGNKQILFLDFDGAFIPRNTFGLGPGTGRLSPLANFLNGFGLQASDENALIDAIVRRTQAKFDFLQVNGGNPSFGLEIRNSKDHPDPWGQPNVSRMIVGGGGTSIGLPGLLGIAQSVDPGNFNREETALTLLEGIVVQSNAVQVNGTATRLEMIAELVVATLAREAGHYFGAWNQDAFNNLRGLMDQFSVSPAIDAGVGPDNFFGTSDDTPLQFHSDIFPVGGGAGAFLDGGVNDSITWLAFGLSSGRQGGRIEGSVYTDVNANLRRDSGEVGRAGVRVFADLNNNGLRSANEPSTLTNASGNYSLLVAPGNYVVRTELIPGLRLLSPALANYVVTAGLNQTITGRDFGYEHVNPAVTGFKWDDVNGDGIAQPAEPRLSGVWIYIDLDGDKRIDIGEPATQTAADGTYRLIFPGPGQYVVREVLEPGFVQIFPGTTVRQSPDGRVTTEDFGFRVQVTGIAAIDSVNLAGLNFGNRSVIDYGDAPASYGTLKANNGAAHGFVEGLTLGTKWDQDGDGQPSPAANGDDLNGNLDSNNVVIDDEDGVLLARPLVRGRNDNTFSVTITNTTGSAAFLQGWVDFNVDGDFLDSGEQIYKNVQLATGTHALSFTAPSTATLGTTFARFRYSQEQNLTPTGKSGSGEVEDYTFAIVSTLDLAVDDTFTVTRNSTLNDFDVTANDFKLPGETLTIVRAGPSSAGGIVQISGAGRILYTPPNGFVGQDVFTYEIRNALGQSDVASVVVNVSLSFDKPVAIDDTFDVATNSVSIPLNVLANDIEGKPGALTIISVTQPNKGGQITISTGGQSLRYTPARNLGDTEQFRYTVSDSAGNVSTATVTIHLLPGDRSDDDVAIKLVATDLSGNPITSIPQGQQFKIDVLIDDNRNDRGVFASSYGVFSAYLDLLYNLQLVSTVPSQTPGSRFDFDVSFFNDYTNFTLGDASIPGIINDFGAFSSRSILSIPDFVKMASITFTARSPGIAVFQSDPADKPPETDTTLFNIPNSPVPIERIQYLGTSLEIVGDSVEFPLAVDDAFVETIPLNAVNFPLNVLANDRPGSTGIISLVSTTQPLNGTASIFDPGTPNNPADDVVRYTPNSGFFGSNQFNYTIQDARGVQSTARVTVKVGNQAADNDEAALRLDVTDLNGTPIGSNTITVGSQFQLRGFVQDLRSAFGSNRGIFAAYEDVLYSSRLVSPVANATNPLGFQVQFGPNYTQVQSGDIRTPGLVNEIGAVQIGNNNAPLGSQEQLLFVVTFTATSVGDANFAADPADLLPLHDTLTFEPAAPISFDRIRYGFDSVRIVAGSGGAAGEGNTNLANPYDVNADGFVSPIDALMVINSINRNGSSVLSGGGEGEGASRLYLDVNADGTVSPIDVLMVVNYLNTQLQGNGEGASELAAVQSAGSLAQSSASGLGEINPVAAQQTDISEPTGLARIGSRMTSHNYGPIAPEFLDTGFDNSIATDEASMDDLLDQLAPDIEQTWKRNRLA